MDALKSVLLPKLEGVRYSAGSWMARCPAHEDAKASLHISRGEKHPVVLKCHAGCDPVDILLAVGLTWDDLCAPREEATREDPRAILAAYDYTDEDGALLYQVVRRPGKRFVQRVPDPARPGEWIWKLGGTRRVLYRLPKVAQAVRDGEVIYVCEGEKDVHALENAGVVATCNSGGAGKWHQDFAEVLRGAIVIVIADKDAPGQAHARQVAETLDGVAAAVEIVEAAGQHKDASDHLGAGLGLADFEVTHEAVPEPPADLSMDVYDFIAIVDPPNEWIIPGLLDRGDRLIWTGFEGLGKSVISRQLAVCAAAGIHPFTGQTFRQQRVLFIDCENPDKKSRKHFRKLIRIARFKGHPVPVNHLRILQHPDGVDLTKPEGVAWLLERVTAYPPDLLVISPFYKLHETDANEELAARAVVSALDKARVKAGCALITEAHPGHGADSQKRSVRPAGSSLLMRWPEFGYGMKPLGEADDFGHHHFATVQPWRGPRETRHWPQSIEWGPTRDDWPWVPSKPMAYFTDEPENDE